MPIDYLLYEQRPADSQYRDRLITVRDDALPASSFHKEQSRTYMALQPLRFQDLSLGFPVSTIRDLKGSWKSAIGEILAFINGVRTQEQLVNDFGVNKRFWGDFVTKDKCAIFGLEEGDLGDGSYGAGFARFPTPDGSYFDQMKNVMHQIRTQPNVRTHWVDPWIPFYVIQGEHNQRKVVVAPCHGWMHWRVLQGKLHLQMHQRSADMPVGVVFNTLQYAALLLVVAHVLRMEPGGFYHSFSDAHIYEPQIPWVDELVSREPRQLPTMTLSNDAPLDLYQFRSDHFTLTDYHPHPVVKDMPVAI